MLGKWFTAGYEGFDNDDEYRAFLRQGDDECDDTFGGGDDVYDYGRNFSSGRDASDPALQWLQCRRGDDRRHLLHDDGHIEGIGEEDEGDGSGDGCHNSASARAHKRLRSGAAASNHQQTSEKPTLLMKPPLVLHRTTLARDTPRTPPTPAAQSFFFAAAARCVLGWPRAASLPEPPLKHTEDNNIAAMTGTARSSQSPPPVAWVDVAFGGLDLAFRYHHGPNTTTTATSSTGGASSPLASSSMCPDRSGAVGSAFHGWSTSAHIGRSSDAKKKHSLSVHVAAVDVQHNHNRDRKASAAAPCDGSAASTEAPSSPLVVLPPCSEESSPRTQTLAASRNGIGSTTPSQRSSASRRSSSSSSRKDGASSFATFPDGATTVAVASKNRPVGRFGACLTRAASHAHAALLIGGCCTYNAASHRFHSSPSGAGALSVYGADVAALAGTARPDGILLDPWLVTAEGPETGGTPSAAPSVSCRRLATMSSPTPRCFATCVSVPEDDDAEDGGGSKSRGSAGGRAISARYILYGGTADGQRAIGTGVSGDARARSRPPADATDGHDDLLEDDAILVEVGAATSGQPGAPPRAPKTLRNRAAARDELVLMYLHSDGAEHTLVCEEVDRHDDGHTAHRKGRRSRRWPPPRFGHTADFIPRSCEMVVYGGASNSFGLAHSGGSGGSADACLSDCWLLHLPSLRWRELRLWQAGVPRGVPSPISHAASAQAAHPTGVAYAPMPSRAFHAAVAVPTAGEDIQPYGGAPRRRPQTPAVLYIFGGLISPSLQPPSAAPSGRMQRPLNVPAAPALLASVVVDLSTGAWRPAALGLHDEHQTFLDAERGPQDEDMFADVLRELLVRRGGYYKRLAADPKSAMHPLRLDTLLPEAVATSHPPDAHQPHRCVAGYYADSNNDPSGGSHVGRVGIATAEAGTGISNRTTVVDDFDMPSDDESGVPSAPHAAKATTAVAVGSQTTMGRWASRWELPKPLVQEGSSVGEGAHGGGEMYEGCRWMCGALLADLCFGPFASAVALPRPFPSHATQVILRGGLGSYDLGLSARIAIADPRQQAAPPINGGVVQVCRDPSAKETVLPENAAPSMSLQTAPVNTRMCSAAITPTLKEACATFLVAAAPFVRPPPRTTTPICHPLNCPMSHATGIPDSRSLRSAAALSIMSVRKVERKH